MGLGVKEHLTSLGIVTLRVRVQVAATPVVTHLVMPLDGATTMIAVTASVIVVSLVSDNRDIFVTFVLLSLLTVILGRLRQLLVIVLPAPLVVLFLFTYLTAAPVSRF